MSKSRFSAPSIECQLKFILLPTNRCEYSRQEKYIINFRLGTALMTKLKKNDINT